MFRSKSICIAACLLLVAAGVVGTQASAQAVYGSILGTVTDPQGAAVVGATITVTSVGKGISETATSNESGNYSVTHLIPDVYTVRIEAKGFKTINQQNVVVSADNGSRVDEQFTVGGAQEVVEVTSEAPQLKTDRADVAVEFSGKQLAELPILNRNFQSLELLTPGTQVITGWSHAATENPQGSKQIFVNGQHFSGTGYQLDGTDNQDPILGIIIVNPSLDSVQETKIATQNYDAEFGKATAGIMTAQTKSGSNEIHGSGYYYDLNPKDPAKNPFTNAPQPNNWKQFGGALGGAIVKNKVFVFGDYEATRRTAGTSFTINVPTALVRSTCLTAGTANCDLSEYLGNVQNGGNGQVYNPYQPQGARTAYVGNVIPQGDLQLADAASAGCAPNCTTLTTAEKILAALPAPNAAGTNGGTLNNYSASGSGSFNDYQYVFRGDYIPTQKLQVFGRYTHANFKLSGAPVFGTAVGGPGLGYLGLAGQSVINNYSLASGFNYTLSNTLLMDFRFGYFRYNPHSTKFDGGTAAATNLGLPGLNTSDPTTGGLPALYFDQTIGNGSQGGYGFNNQGSTGLGEGLNVGRCNCPLVEKEQGEQFVNNWTKISGNHQFKFGADLRHASNLRVPSDANRTGQLQFSHLGTSDGAASATGGLDLATYLFSEVTYFDRYVGSPGEPSAIETQNRYFFYGQDTWRPTTKLTVNYGLRWELYTPENVNKKGNGGFGVLPEGVIRVAGYGNISNNGNTANNYKNFAPRLGIAYEVTPKTVVRLGYGRSFDIGVFGSNFGHTVTQNLPVLAHQILQASGFDSKSAAFNFTTGPIPNSFPVVPSNGILPLFGPCSPGSVGDCFNPSVGPRIRPDKVVVPTVDAWNATVQTQLTRTLNIEAGYVANHGSHVFKGNGNSYNPNQATIVGFGTLSYAQRSPYNDAFQTPYVDSLGNATIVHCCQGQGFNYSGSDGTNSYKALQIKATQRAGGGLTLLAHYTYSRAYDNDGSYQPQLSQGYGRQDFNRDSELVITSLYELPFGKGKKYMGNIGRAADLLVGGWQWNSAVTIASGLPFSPTYENCGQDRDTGPCRTNGGISVGAGSLNAGQVKYFKPVIDPANVAGVPNCPVVGGVLTKLNGYSCDGALLNGDTINGVGRPLVATFGTAQRNSLTGPGEILADMSLFKNFSITERVKAQFQMEFFNVFNHKVLNGPNNCLDCNAIDGAGNITGQNGGLITGLQGGVAMRQFQLGIRATF